MINKVFQIFKILLALGCFFLTYIGYDSITYSPTDQELVDDCNYLIRDGAYEQYPFEDRLNLCLEDSYKSLAGIPVFGFIWMILFGVFGLLFVRSFVRRYKSKEK